MRIDNISQIAFDDQGLVPVIVQDATYKDVLMLAYMNVQALQKTLQTGQTWFYSRSRQSLWHKGMTSGNTQEVKEVLFDCDADTLLVLVDQLGDGKACHENTRSCFHYQLQKDGSGRALADYQPNQGIALGSIVEEVRAVIEDRKEKMPEGSYTTYLFEKGIDKILKKVGEECTESVIAAKNNDKEEIANEVSDLLYHLLVMLSDRGVSLGDIAQVLKGRR